MSMTVFILVCLMLLGIAYFLQGRAAQIINGLVIVAAFVLIILNWVGRV
jgi:hypothetical protein